MYGLIFDCFENFIASHYSRATWTSIVTKAFFAFSKNQITDDTCLYKERSHNDHIIVEQDEAATAAGSFIEATHPLRPRFSSAATKEPTRRQGNQIQYTEITEERYAAEGWLPNCSYPDSLFSCLCAAAVGEVDIQSEEIIRGCGFYFLDFMR
jgi:hypothetical protein